MSRKQCKRHSPDQKMAILKRHLLDRVPISQVCGEAGIHPTVFYRWQKERAMPVPSPFNMALRLRRAAASVVVLAALLAAPCCGQAATRRYPELPELNWEQRSDWLNVKTGMAGIGPAAIGDGVADDTEALQAAFDEIHGKQGGSPFSTVYLPPGTYRITRELYPKRHETVLHYQSLHIRGHGQSTRIVWDGPEGGRMFRAVQWSHSTFIGVVWDGRNRAAHGFIHDGGSDTRVLHQHQAFVNFTGIGAGTPQGPKTPGFGDNPYLEGSEWRNCLFINCGIGLSVGWWNDYVITVDGCDFHDCGYGISSVRGNFYARNCHFERSKQYDIMNGNDTEGCSARRCTSVGSRAFYHRGGSVGTLFTIQDCHVSDWTNPAGYAVISTNSAVAPMLIFDSAFTNAPSATPPILLEGPTPVVHSDNTTSTPDLFGGSTEHVLEVPKGERRGSITSAHQSFFRNDAAIPTKVFDAKRDFGARGDGRTEDTDAIQRCIDAARQYGRGAIAYLPRGDYRISKTINITGRDYYVGGADLSTPVSGGTFLVSDPQNVTMEYLQLGGCTVRQVSTVPQPSRMHYEHLREMTMELVGLPKDSIVTTGGLDCFTGTLLIDNCSDARVLLGYIAIARTHVRGAQGGRAGFLGLLASQSQFLIEDNQSLVGGDCYQEQMGQVAIKRDFPYAILRGSPTLPAGRVTLSGPKLCGYAVPGNPAWRQMPYEEYFTVDDYRGRLSSVLSGYANWHERYDPDKTAFKIVCSGEAPLDIVLMANAYNGGGRSDDRRTKPLIDGGSNVTRTLLANWLNSPGGEPLPDVLHPNSLLLAAQALDDFRELGELDLRLNHPDMAVP